MQQVNLGMIGGGTVGSGVCHALEANGALMASRIGVKVQVHTGAAVSALLPSSLFGDRPSEVSPSAAELYARALVLINSSPPYEDGHLPLPQTDLDRVRNSGVNVIKLSLGGINSGPADTVQEIAYIQQMIEAPPDFTQVRVPSDLERAKSEGKLGIILSFESADMLEGKLERFELFESRRARDGSSPTIASRLSRRA